MLSLIAAMVLSGPTGLDQQRASVVLGEVWNRYDKAPSVDGKIITWVYENDRQINTVETHLSYIRGDVGKLYIHQAYFKLSDPVGSREEYLVTGDGQFISFNVPRDTYDFEAHKNRRLTDELFDEEKLVEGQYKIIVNSLKDRSVPLDIAIAGSEDLEHLAKTWDEIRVVQDESAPVGAKVVVGRFRAYPDSPLIGDFRMVIGPENDLLFYETLVNWMIEGILVPVRTVYEVDLKIGVSIPAERFKVIR